MSRPYVPKEILQFTMEERMQRLAYEFRVLTRRARSERASGVVVAPELLEDAAALLDGARHRLANEDAA